MRSLNLQVEPEVNTPIPRTVEVYLDSADGRLKFKRNNGEVVVIGIGPGAGGSVAGRLAVFTDSDGNIDDSPAIDSALVCLSPAATVLDSIPIWGDTVGNLSDPNLLILTSNLLRPTNTNLFDLGRSSSKFKRGFFGTSLEMGTTFTTSLTVRTSSPYSGQLEVNPSLVTQGGLFTPIDLNAALGESLATGGAANLRFSSVEVIAIGLGDESGGTYDFGTAIYSISSPAYTADRVLTLDMGNGSRTLRLTGNLTGDQDVSTTGTPTFSRLTLTDAVNGLQLNSSSGGALKIVGLGAETLVRTLTISHGGTNRTITLTGNPTLADWFDQALKAASSPTFAGLTLTGDLSVQGNTTIGNATTDTVRLNAGGNAAAPATNAIGVIIDYFGTSATRVLTTPNRWTSVIADDGNTYKIPLYS